VRSGYLSVLSLFSLPLSKRFERVTAIESGKVAVEPLARIQAPELRLVSCDPSTLVRDLALLIAAGYQVEEMVLIDLFPQTFHIETVTKLRMG